jgi:hypothetical protein
LKATFFCISFFTFLNPDVSAQPNIWDVPLTESLISHNKHNYSDHQEARNNQLVSTATVSAWKNAKDNFKQLVDNIDNRLTQAFIIVADVTTLYNTITALKEIEDYQEEAFLLLYKYPFAMPIFYQREVDLVKSAIELYSFVYLIIVSYGDISKMEVAARQTVFREMSTLINVLRAKAFSLLQKLKQIDFAEIYQGTQVWQFINKDKQLAEDIIKNFKH